MPLMVLLMLHEPHLRQTWQLDSCFSFMPFIHGAAASGGRRAAAAVAFHGAGERGTHRAAAGAAFHGGGGSHTQWIPLVCLMHLMVLLMMHAPHRHQPRQLDRCFPFIRSFYSFLAQPSAAADAHLAGAARAQPAIRAFVHKAGAWVLAPEPMGGAEQGRLPIMGGDDPATPMEVCEDAGGPQVTDLGEAMDLEQEACGAAAGPCPMDTTPDQAPSGGPAAAAQCWQPPAWVLRGQRAWASLTACCSSGPEPMDWEPTPAAVQLSTRPRSSFGEAPAAPPRTFFQHLVCGPRTLPQACSGASALVMMGLHEGRQMRCSSTRSPIRPRQRDADMSSLRARRRVIFCRMGISCWTTSFFPAATSAFA